MTRIKRNSTLVLLSLSLFFACNSKNRSSANTDAASSDKTVSDAAPIGNASWSATIDGVEVTGKGTDELQLRNTAFIYPAQGDKDKYILFDLNSDKKGDDFYGFRFYSPDKEGQFTVQDAKKAGYRYSVRLDFNLRSTDNFAIYSGDALPLVIDKISSTEISGTFSGQLKLSDLSRSKPYKQEISVANGKFDIPFSTGNLRPE